MNKKKLFKLNKYGKYNNSVGRIESVLIVNSNISRTMDKFPKREIDDR